MLSFSNTAISAIVIAFSFDFTQGESSEWFEFGPRRSLTEAGIFPWLDDGSTGCGLQGNTTTSGNISFQLAAATSVGISDVVYMSEADILSNVPNDTFFLGAMGRVRSDETGSGWILPIAMQAAQVAFVTGTLVAPPVNLTEHSFHVLFVDLCDEADACSHPQTASLTMPVLLGSRLVGKSTSPVLAMVGGDDYMVTVASLAAGSITPLISYADSNQALANRETYPTFMRTNPVIEAVAQAEAAVLLMLNLTKVDALGCNTAEGEERVARLSSTMQAAGIVPTHQELVSIGNLTGWAPGSLADGNSSHAVLAEWEAAVERILAVNAHVHLNHMDQSCPDLDFMHWVGLKGLVGGGHLWLGVNIGFMERYNCLYVPGITTQSSAEFGVQSPLAGAKPFDGYVAFDTTSASTMQDAWYAFLEYVVENQDSFLPTWLHDRLPAGFFNTFAESDMARDTLFLADAMFAALRAINDLANVRGMAVTTEDLLDALDATDLDGVSGNVRFSGSGDRQLDIQVLQYRMQAGTVGISPATVGQLVKVGTFDTAFEQVEDFLFYDGRTEAPPSEDLDCQQGLFYNRTAGECNECRPGTFTSVSAQASCELCDTGFFSDAIGATRCEVCAPGRFSSTLGLTSCLLCQPGTFQADMQETSCQDCAAGSEQASEGGIECTPCRAGTFANTQRTTACASCEPGSYADFEASTECHLCEIGTFAPTNGTAACEPCPLGSYSEQLGSSFCESCAEGKRDEFAWATMVFSEVEQAFIYQSGTTSNASCSCRRDYWEDAAGECVPCGEGLSCQGMDEIFVLEGYYSAGPYPSVYRCFGDSDRCAGGRPGDTCADGRTGKTCAECLGGRTPAQGGKCVVCVGMDFIPMIFVCLAAFLGLVGVYLTIDKSNRATQSHAMLLSAAAVSMLITVVQQIGVVSTISVEWVSPITDVFEAVRLLNFDISVLRLGCVSDFNPTSRFSLKVLLIFILIFCMVVIHCMVVLVLYKGRFRERMPSLLGSVGTCFMVCYISIVTTVLGPLQCQEHPNGKWTARSYQSVSCWDSEEHTAMFAIGMAAMLLPLGYLAKCIHITLRFPLEMRAANTGFLKAYSFLFFRFKAQLHWYVLILLVRSLLLGLMPVVPNAILQITLIQLIVLVCVLITSHCCPWRVGTANVLDVSFQVMIVTFVALAAFFVEYTSDDQKQVAWIAYIFILVVVCAVPLALAYAVISKYLWKTYQFQYFLCHHKAGAGAYTRLLKLCLQQESHHKLKGQVFVDSDNLDNLDMLFSYVHDDTETLVVLASREIFTRPWCVGEMTVARLHQVKVVLIQMPDFETPSEDLIRNYQTFVPDLQALTQNGIGLPDIEETLEWIVEEPPRMKVPSCVTQATMSDFVLKLVHKDYDATVQEIPDPEHRGEVAMLVDGDNLEAEASAQVLRMMLMPHLAHTTSRVPGLLSHTCEAPVEVNTLLLLFSAGCIEKQQFIKRLQGCVKVPQIFSILLDPTFRIPSSKQINEVCQKEADAATVLRNATKQAAISFQPMYAADSLLQVNAKETALRLLNIASPKIGSKFSDSTGQQSASSWKKTDSKRPRSARSTDQDAPLVAAATSQVGPAASSEDSFVSFTDETGDHVTPL
mmetsp:Transcript_34383/g.78352  ORF Transcript_34383/g.78352 Transcript_34383/m.78352 type:complete len:1613 (-) Transcript_34383:77-4915(-)